LITGPARDIGPNLCAISLIVGLSFLWFYLICPELTKNKVLIAMVTIDITIYIILLVCLVCTKYSDPGIIPKKMVYEVIKTT